MSLSAHMRSMGHVMAPEGQEDRKRGLWGCALCHFWLILLVTRTSRSHHVEFPQEEAQHQGPRLQQAAGSLALPAAGWHSPASPVLGSGPGRHSWVLHH